MAKQFVINTQSLKKPTDTLRASNKLKTHAPKQTTPMPIPTVAITIREEKEEVVIDLEVEVEITLETRTSAHQVKSLWHPFNTPGV
jgi:hypothetical protein